MLCYMFHDHDDEEEDDDNSYVIIMKMMVVVVIVNQVVWGVLLSDWKSAFVLFCMLYFFLKCFCLYRLKRVVACCSML